tara:strand:- start:63 stop:626 length:564 start_codon:yes stop_codon:yes gene_type:complete
MPLGSARFGLGGVDLGKLQLIQTVEASGTPSTIDFTSISESTYNVHLVTMNNWLHSDTSQMAIRFYESGVVETSSVYQVAFQRGASDGNFGEAISTGLNMLTINSGVSTGTNRTRNGYFYVYNAGDSSKYTFITQQTSTIDNGGDFNMSFGGGVLPQASTVDGIQILGFSSGTYTQGVFSLYGIKES